MDYIVDLKSATVVERNSLNKLSLDEMNQKLKEIYSKQKPVVMVESIRQYFSVKNLSEVINDPKKIDDLPVILEYMNFDLGDDERTVIEQFHKIKSEIIESVVPANPIDYYQFAPVPEDWNLNEDVIFTSNLIRRRSDNNSIGYKTLEKVWNRARNVWAGKDVSRYINDLRVAGGYYEVTVNDDRVRIGCTSIARHELEQVAKHLNWEFPSE